MFMFFPNQPTIWISKPVSGWKNTLRPMTESWLWFLTLKIS